MKSLRFKTANAGNKTRPGMLIHLATVIVAGGGALTLIGCRTEPAIPKTTTSTQDAKSLALEAKDVLSKRLSGRLMEAMQSGGPVAAIRVCSKEAMEIAESVSKDKGVKIGRTSMKLRNQNNAPPAWAAELMSQGDAEPQFVELPSGHHGALLPIMLQAKCIMCHGPSDQIAGPIKVQLDKLYPDDQATGFKEGELRGWFWVEVPKPG